MTSTSLPLRHAVALGLLQGPTELLPVSSSAHTTLVPFLAGWSYEELDPTLRKSIEVALHAGTAAALLLRRPYDTEGRRPGLPALMAAVAPPALAGYALGRRIEHRLGTPTTIAAGLLFGSGAILAAELLALALRAGGDLSGGALSSRGQGDITVRDGLAVGIAQALALVPGASRSGLALAALRALGLSRHDADRLSWQAGLPVLAGATLLQGLRLARSRPPVRTTVALGAGAAAAFASTLCSVASLTPERRARAVGACAGYRVALAGLAIRRVRMATASNALPFPRK